MSNDKNVMASGKRWANSVLAAVSVLTALCAWFQLSGVLAADHRLQATRDRLEVIRPVFDQTKAEINRPAKHRRSLLTLSDEIEPLRTELRGLIDELKLRGVVTDVGNRLSVVSNLHFTILRRFRETGIEIPIPRRDIHIRRETTDEA
jgi:hypothetical protein